VLAVFSFVLFAAVRWSLLALSGHSLQCSVKVAIGATTDKAGFGSQWLGNE
jgi:hypothetical protein